MVGLGPATQNTRAASSWFLWSFSNGCQMIAPVPDAVGRKEQSGKGSIRSRKKGRMGAPGPSPSCLGVSVCESHRALSRGKRGREEGRSRQGSSLPHALVSTLSPKSHSSCLLFPYQANMLLVFLISHEQYFLLVSEI